MRSWWGLCLFALLGSAGAQSYPDKPVSMVVPFPAGGSTDIVARTLVQRMSEAWGQPVVVFNRVDADGRIGTEFAVRAPPDGYTEPSPVRMITCAPGPCATMGRRPEKRDS